jgi:cyclin-D1-binding protein 1
MHCAQFFNINVHGATLTKEVTSTVQDVIEAIRALVQTFLALQTHVGSGTNKTGEEYLVRTGTVHDLIDRAKGAKGISKDNLGAVRKKWSEDRGTLEDAFREVGEMAEEEEGEDEDGEDDEDGWDGLGLGKGKKMDQKELERTKQVNTAIHSILSNHLVFRIYPGS